jgi:hypothetical protein
MQRDDDENARFKQQKNHEQGRWAAIDDPGNRAGANSKADDRKKHGGRTASRHDGGR